MQDRSSIKSTSEIIALNNSVLSLFTGTSFRKPIRTTSGGVILFTRIGLLHVDDTQQ